MAIDAGGLIRDFKVRGNYVNRRTVLARHSLHHAQTTDSAQIRKGYSPPEVDILFESGQPKTITVSEVDIPFLCDDDFELARRHLSLILSARSGHNEAARQLISATDTHPWLIGPAKAVPATTRYIVPCTTMGSHSAEEISHKATILLRLCQEGYPVPDFVVLTASAYLDREQTLENNFTDAVSALESLTLHQLGGPLDPLVFALRCATPRYIPGVMDTYLNVGITETTLPALEKMYGRTVALRMFLNNLKNICHFLGCEQPAGTNLATRDLTPEEIVGAVDRLLTTVRKKHRELLDDPWYQARFFVRGAYEHFEENRELVLTLARGAQLYPSLILQKMVCTIRDESAYAGVISSRHTQSGIGVELQTAHNMFGEEIMTGTAEIESTTFKKREEIQQSFPGVYHFAPHLAELEQEFESPVIIEFAVEATSRYQWFAVLQLNETGMAGRAALAASLDLYRSGVISRKRVTELIRPYHIKQLSSDSIDEDSFKFLKTFCNGIAVLPRSAVSAQIYFSGEAALDAKSRGEKVCLCKKTFVPTDTVVMREMDAILSLTSAAIHVVTICQSLGIPALLSLETNGVTLMDGDRLVNAQGREIKEGDWITISSRRRVVYEGLAKYKPARLLRYMRGENVEFAPGEREVFDAIAYNYRYYQQIVKAMTIDQISSLDEVTRLVNVELRSSTEEASTLVNSWFDEREDLYVTELFKSDIGDHLVQSRVFDLLTLDRKIRFFKRALAKCSRERLSGYDAGAFMLGRFLSSRYPVTFWRTFSSAEIALLINEWVLFEKYMQLLHNMGERKLLQARKKILQQGLDQLHLHTGSVRSLISLKLAHVPFSETQAAFPDWCDAQSQKVIELLQQPYSAFYDFNARWSLAELERVCREENIPVPQPADV